MDFVHFLYCYFGLTVLLIFVLLFGESPWAAGTPLPYLRWLLSSAWLEGLEWAVNKACGSRGLSALDSATEFCCERSNPTLQIAYLLLYLVGYGLYWQHIFRLLPNSFAAEYHLYTGTAAVCLTLTAFLAASLSEPGRLRPSNAAAYAAAYPADGLLFPTMACSTCNLPRPGRSKHCSICGGCIARFDHHCGWINNCVGLHNMRLFLLFLAANCVTCAYGVLLAAAALTGELQRRGFFDVFIYDPQLRVRVPLVSRPARLLEWVMVYYPVPVAVAAFMAVSGLILAAFLGYQALLISQGRTTYETFKRDSLAREARARALQQQQQQQEGDAGQGTEEAERGGGLLGWWRRRQRRAQQVLVTSHLAPNYYNRGFWGNWGEVLAPDRFLQQQQQQYGDGAAGSSCSCPLQMEGGSSHQPGLGCSGSQKKVE